MLAMPREQFLQVFREHSNVVLKQCSVDRSMRRSRTSHTSRTSPSEAADSRTTSFTNRTTSFTNYSDSHGGGTPPWISADKIKLEDLRFVAVLGEGTSGTVRNRL